MTNTKLKAYTIMELLVVMLLSGVATIIIYNGFLLVSSYASNLQSSFDAAIDTNRLKMLLNDDLENGALVSMSALGIVQVYNDESDEMVSYSFSNSGIIRRQGELKDTFNIQTENFVAHFHGELVTEGMLDMLTFSFKINNEILPYTIKKQYNPFVLIETDRKAKGF